MWCNGLTLENWEEISDEKTIGYLHGHCDDWVNENYVKGDKCVAITEYRDEIETICLMHSCLLRNNQYIDVRGETENFDDIIDAFDYGEFDVEVYETLDSFNERLKELGVR